jgi:hypothetical protein
VQLNFITGLNEIQSEGQAASTLQHVKVEEIWVGGKLLRLAFTTLCSHSTTT